MTGGLYRLPQLLESFHGIDGFECRSSEQTSWLRDHGRQAHGAGTAKVWVVTEEGGNDVVAYYAWAMANLSTDSAPERLLKGAGQYPQPVLLLARLGVDLDHERQGLGVGLLQDVMARTAEMGTKVGCRGLLIHAESEEARSFYLHLVPEFEPSPTDPLHLVLLMKDIRRTLRSQ